MNKINTFSGEESQWVDKVHCGDALDILKQMPDTSINCCITSPPYWGLRDYGTAEWEGGDENCDHVKMIGKQTGLIGMRGENDKPGKNYIDGNKIPYLEVCKKCGAVRIDNQLGLEKTPEEYVEKLVAIFREVKRVLKNDGNLWINLGDSYNGSGKAGKKDNPYFNNHTEFGKPASNKHKIGIPTNVKGLKPKDLVGIPWRVAFALQADGWYLRSDIIWHKKNPMPESVTDRPTKSHEYVFLLSKSQKYYYDAKSIGTKIQPDTIERYKRSWNGDGDRDYPHGVQNHIKKFMDPNNEKRQWSNKRSVWTVNTKGYIDAHFATFPEKLVVDMIKAGCPEKGIVLDPFMGAGTVALVAKKFNRNYIGIELNKEYIDIANKRLYKELGMFI